VKQKAPVTSVALSGHLTLPISGVGSPFTGFSAGSFHAYGVDLAGQEALIQQHKKVTSLRRALKGKRRRIRSLSAKVQELQREQEEFDRQSVTSAIRKRISSAAQKHLARKPGFFARFIEDKPVDATVLAVDIRRSTDLMLHCASPAAFVEFISSLCVKLATIATDAHGVFDKFTGDGILAFFPSFFSGIDHAAWALRAALDCQEFWDDHFKKYARHFKRLPGDTGLGIGIDTGALHISVMNDDIIIVGEPVVYACRFSSAAKFKETLLNQNAHGTLLKRKRLAASFTPQTVQIKEGLFVAYKSARSLPRLALAGPARRET
jgi:class 3 adenylate cyclase